MTDKEFTSACRSASIARCCARSAWKPAAPTCKFAVNPCRWSHGRYRDEPARVASRLSLASKATGFPIAKVAAKLAVGYTLDEIGPTTLPAGDSRELRARPSITLSPRFPRFAFENISRAEALLTTSMKSVGEAMAMGRTFQESMQKARAAWRRACGGF